MAKRIFGVTFLDRKELEKQTKKQSCEMYEEVVGKKWEDIDNWYKGSYRKVLSIIIAPFDLATALVKIAIHCVVAPLNVLAFTVKELGEVVLRATNGFVLYPKPKKDEKEASD